MTYWLTTQWPLLRDPPVTRPNGVWLRDNKKHMGSEIHPGDQVLVYQLATGPVEIYHDETVGEDRRFTRTRGRQGIVALFRVVDGKPESHERRYGTGRVTRWWRWPVEVLSVEGFVPRKDVNRALGYDPKYNYRGFGGGSGLRKIEPEQWRKLTEMAGGWRAEGVNDLEEEIAEAIQRVQTRASGQGFSSSPKVRKAVEKRAMDLAIEHFEGEGYAVVVKGKPYDLHCTRGDEILYVEVKGTQEAGSNIILTRNEVKFVIEKTPQTSLFIVHGIRIDGIPENPVASGGTKRFIIPWSIEESALSPLAFQYVVPPEV